MKITSENFVLKIENLSVVFENKSLFKKKEILPVLDDINLEVGQGEFVALVGESGCGKTMTTLSITNLLPENARITEGRILFSDGKGGRTQDLTKLSKKEYKKVLGNDISMIFQDPLSALNPLMKIGPQIMETGIAHGMTKVEAHKKAVENLTLVGIAGAEGIMNVFPKDLSGGMMQRGLIAQSLMNNPKLLIADEPTTALDATVQAEIIEILISLKEKTGTSLLLITHDLGVVSKLCSRIYVMYAGQIIEQGETEEVLKNPLHPYTKALIGTIPDINQRNRKLPVLHGIVPSLSERKCLTCRFAERCPECNTKCVIFAPNMENVTQNHGVRCTLIASKESRNLSSGGEKMKNV